MDAQGVDLPSGDRLDTPPRSINTSYYPHLLALYAEAGVELEPFCWDFSFSDVKEDSSQDLVMCLATVCGRALPVRSQSLWSTLSVSASALKLYRHMQRDVTSPAVASGMDFGTWLDTTGPYCTQYLDLVLMPALAVWLTASYDSVRRYPAVVVFDFVLRHSMASNYHTKHGSGDAARKLSAHVHQLHLGAHVTRVRPAGSDADTPTPRPTVEYTCPTTGDQLSQPFDAVILATQLDHVAALLPDGDRTLLAALAAVRHEESEVVVHTDTSFLPSARRDWMPANFNACPGRGQASCTLFFELPGSGPVQGGAAADQGDARGSKKPVCARRPDEGSPAAPSAHHLSNTWSLLQTWNSLRPVDSSRVLSRYSFKRPMVTVPETERMLQALWGAQGAGGVWFVGAYANLCVPLQESGVTSAARVCAALGCAPAWLSPEVAAQPLAAPCTARDAAAALACTQHRVRARGGPPRIHSAAGGSSASAGAGEEGTATKVGVAERYGDGERGKWQPVGASAGWWRALVSTWGAGGDRAPSATQSPPQQGGKLGWAGNSSVAGQALVQSTALVTAGGVLAAAALAGVVLLRPQMRR